MAGLLGCLVSEDSTFSLTFSQDPLSSYWRQLCSAFSSSFEHVLFNPTGAVGRISSLPFISAALLGSNWHF